MNMQTAVRRGFRRTFDWQGRASRSEYWWFLLASMLFYMGCMSIAAVLENPVVLLAWALLFVVPTLGVSARRLHDSDRSALWLLVLPVGTLNLVLLVFYCLPGTLGPNRYGPPDDAAPQARAYRKLGRRYSKIGDVHRAAGYTALGVVYGNEAGKDVEGDLARLADQREVLGDRKFRLCVYEVLDPSGAEALFQALDESHPRPASGAEAGLAAG